MLAGVKSCLLTLWLSQKQRKMDAGAQMSSSFFSLCIHAKALAHRIVAHTLRRVLPSQLIVSGNDIITVSKGMVHQDPRHFLIQLSWQ